MLVSTQANALIHLAATLLVILLGLLLRINALEWALLAISVGTVWTAEAFNTALEFLVDLVHPARHPLAGHIKDLAAAAVLLTSIMAFIVGIAVFAPKIWLLLTIN